MEIDEIKIDTQTLEEIAAHTIARLFLIAEKAKESFEFEDRLFELWHCARSFLRIAMFVRGKGGPEVGVHFSLAIGNECHRLAMWIQKNAGFDPYTKWNTKL